MMEVQHPRGCMWQLPALRGICHNLGRAGGGKRSTSVTDMIGVRGRQSDRRGYVPASPMSHHRHAAPAYASPVQAARAIPRLELVEVLSTARGLFGLSIRSAASCVVSLGHHRIRLPPRPSNL